MAAEDLLKTGGAVWRSIHCSASTRMPQPNKRQSVGSGREARSGAITRQGSAGQPIWAAWPPSARPAVLSLGTLAHPLFIKSCSPEPFSETMLVRARTALHGSAGMSFSRFQAWLKPCLGSLEQGTGQQCLWTLWRARIQRPNRTPSGRTERRTDTRRT
jgi:hypothetical protein